jgi:hypothetical protein
MSNQITTAFVQQYTSNVKLLLQQGGSRLRKAVTQETAVGNSSKMLEQVGAVTAQKKIARHADTPLIETPHAARWVDPIDYEWADLIDDQDKIRTLIDPESPYAKNGANALGRAMDEEILLAAFATSKTGQTGTGTEAWSTDYDTTVSGTGVTTIGNLLEGIELLMAANVDPDEQKYMAITAQTHADILNITEVKSLDYNTRPVMVDGVVVRFLGIDFIHTQLVNRNATPDDISPLWVKSGLALCLWNDITTKIDPRPDKSYATQVYVKGTFGATRLELGRVVRVICDIA